MTVHDFTPDPAHPRRCLKCPYPSQHPAHRQTPPAVSMGTMHLSVEAGGAATVILPDGSRMSGVLYPR